MVRLVIASWKFAVNVISIEKEKPPRSMAVLIECL
jgi:hypothetical protein